MSRAIFVTLATSLLVPAAVLAQDSKSAQVQRGQYLVTTSLCHDCHTPLVNGPDGPAPDTKRALSGHPQEIAVRQPASVQEPWVGAMTATLTAWSGPWGVSFSANLTPDPETGVLRDFTEDQFVQTLRTGRHLGQGRQILPPMPWPLIGQMTDDDLKAIYAYLKQIPPVRNRVPDPIPPAAR
jgi:hypothetical protein